MTVLESLPLWLIFLISVVLIVGASEVGRRLGVRAAATGAGSVATLEGAVLGLLALMVGFSFSMALTRFDARRDGVLNEANAIGTTALRARLLPAPYNATTLRLLREYTDIRVKLADQVSSPEQINTATERSNSIQEQLWQQVKAVAAKDAGLVPTGLFIQTLNEMIDNQEKRVTALRNRVPGVVLLGLYAIAIVASGFTGYSSGLDGSRARLPMYVMAILVAGVILLIQDLDRPGTGFVTVSQQPMRDTAASLAGFQD
jgi:hypothetical protein